MKAYSVDNCNVYKLDWKEFDAVSDYAAYSDEKVKEYQRDHPNKSSIKTYSVPVSVRRDALIQILNDDVKSNEDMQVIKEAAYAWNTVKNDGKYVIKHAVSNPYGNFIPVAGDFAVSQNEAHGKYSGYECGKEPVKIDSTSANFLTDYEKNANDGKWYYTPDDVSANNLENVSWVDALSDNYCGYEKFNGDNKMEIFLACEQGIPPIEQENKNTPCSGWEATDYWKDCHTEFKLNVTPGKDTGSIKSNEGAIGD